MATRAKKTTRRQAKGQPFTVRFTRATQAAIEEEARRTKRTRTALVEELADEALRTRLFPGIAFRDSFPSRRAWLSAPGIDVWELCELVDRYPDVETLVADFPHLTRAHVDLALAYRKTYRDEINRMIAENRRTPEEWRRLYPSLADAS